MSETDRLAEAMRSQMSAPQPRSFALPSQPAVRLEMEDGADYRRVTLDVNGPVEECAKVVSDLGALVQILLTSTREA